ncbi:hypothetical protein MLD38_021190 [Melastoma candidum]|uniref:Uncharacterized protein n=1 Tax=Melastoma candidum TaxID=119954 RepID=A0ACB9QIP1_9MYRT|nr:hypothetical protein MLD38_021190 [Melastoma candidum]
MAPPPQHHLQHRIQSKPRSRISRTLRKVVAFNPSKSTPGRDASHIPSICLLARGHPKHCEDSQDADLRRRSLLHAFISRVFASTTSIKAAYLDLQLAQSPYDSDAIQRADQGIVDELKLLSDLKRRFLRREIEDAAPHVTAMLSEIQEQQALLKTYQVTMKKLESQIDAKAEEVAAFRRRLGRVVSENKELHRKVNASGVLRSSVFSSFRLATLSVENFVQFSQYAVRSIRNFAKMMAREMENAGWDFDEAIRVLVPGTKIPEPGHKLFAFEAYVAKLMLRGFNLPDFGISMGEEPSVEGHDQNSLFREFKDLAMYGDCSDFITRHPESDLGRFIRSKYPTLVHAKMECSFFGSLRIRKAVGSGGLSGLGSVFFDGFVEMTRRVWALHRLGRCFDSATVFEVRKGCRFSDVYMECANDEDGLASGPDFRVGFTIVPGFRVGMMVVQAQVYMSPANLVNTL